MIRRSMFRRVFRHAIRNFSALTALSAFGLSAQAQLAQVVSQQTALAAESASIYPLALNLTDQTGRSFTLGQHRGRPLLITMFYTSCQVMCPLLVDTLRRTDAATNPQERAAYDILLVSLDPARDTTAILAAAAAKFGLDSAHWTLARVTPRDVRKLAAALDIRYRQLADGDFSHSSMLILLDREGRIAARTEKMGAIDPFFLAAMRQVLAAK